MSDRRHGEQKSKGQEKAEGEKQDKIAGKDLKKRKAENDEDEDEEETPKPKPKKQTEHLGESVGGLDADAVEHLLVLHALLQQRHHRARRIDTQAADSLQDYVSDKSSHALMSTTAVCANVPCGLHRGGSRGSEGGENGKKQQKGITPRKEKREM